MKRTEARRPQSRGSLNDGQELPVVGVGNGVARKSRADKARKRALQLGMNEAVDTKHHGVGQSEDSMTRTSRQDPNNQDVT